MSAEKNLVEKNKINIYLFKVVIETLENDAKYVQS